MVCMGNEKMDRVGRMADLYLELPRGVQIILLNLKAVKIEIL